MPKKKLYQPREVDGLIPHLEKILRHIDHCRSRAEALAKEAQALVGAQDAATLARAQLLRSQVEFLKEAVQDDAAQVTALGGVLKDVEAGLVDFPGRVEGNEVWLCWKRGENRVNFWHALHEGFSQRQALHRGDAKTIYH
jgi:hypothetical protein